MRGSVQGHVVRADGVTPIIGATVSIVRGPGATSRITVRTDDYGTFTLSDLTTGEWLLSAASGRGKGELTSVRVYDNAVTALTIPLGGEGTVPGENSMTGSVRGKVVGAKNRKPLSNATITVLRGSGPAPDIAPVTNRSGSFVLDGLPEGEWVLQAIGPHGEIGEVTVFVTAESTVPATIKVSG